ncbi:Mur ligase domain-containing protein, partial [Candidatus Gracilibacteria bacterium]|nr:Mur ligase domain-containing protein [Candidatus Gracilibacteria bacterium]
MNKIKTHIHIIGIGGIGTSAIARYYKHNGYRVSGSDSTDSELIETLKSEDIEVYIGENPDIIT